MNRPCIVDDLALDSVSVSGSSARLTAVGVGAKMLRSMMKEKNVSSLEEMISLARELGVRMIACEMSRDLMGSRESELISGLECGGVASFLADSLKSRTSLFI
jgi:peroxiredoxin family protein